MRILVLYATTEGQTRKIARFIADRLNGQGHSVELCPVEQADGLEADRFDAAFLGASLHLGRYQEEFRDYLLAAAPALDTLPTFFFAVSLAAAGDDPQDWEGLDAAVGKLLADTGWTPHEVLHVAGAFRFTQYDFFRSWAMRWIAHHKGIAVNPKEDLELTDWAALGAAVDRWIAAQAAA